MNGESLVHMWHCKLLKMFYAELEDGHLVVITHESLIPVRNKGDSVPCKYWAVFVHYTVWKCHLNVPGFEASFEAVYTKVKLLLLLFQKMLH